MQFWIQLKRRFSTIGTNLSWTMFGLVVFTVTAALIVVVSFIGWYYDLLLDHASQILAKQYNISDTNQQKLLEEANIRAERDLSLAVLSPTEQWVLLTLIGLTLLLPSLLAWWLSTTRRRNTSTIVTLTSGFVRSIGPCAAG